MLPVIYRDTWSLEDPLLVHRQTKNTVAAHEAYMMGKTVLGMPMVPAVPPLECASMSMMSMFQSRLTVTAKPPTMHLHQTLSPS